MTSGPPRHVSLDETLLTRWAALWRANPEQEVLFNGEGEDEALTGQSLLDRTAGAAATLRSLSVAPGDRVIWCCGSSLDSIVVLLGALRLGAVVVPVSAAQTQSELAYVIEDVRPKVAIVDRPDRADMVDAAKAVVRLMYPHDAAPEGTTGLDPFLDTSDPSHDALIVYTSGTTGEPKGAVHTHASLLAGTDAIGEAWDWQADDDLILALPLFHVHGLCAGLFGTLARGASATIFDRFRPDAVADAVPLSTMFFGVPTMYHRLAQSGRAAELASLRLCVAGSAPLPADLWHQFDREYGVQVLERYGMSETLLTLSNPLQGERRPGSVGLPLPGVEATIGETDEDGIGELLVRGPSVCRGYWERDEATAAMWHDGWFATGDLASVADDGYISIRGRRTELIITGGHNVYPAEVEAVLASHPSVLEVAVVGQDSEEWGESVTAFLVGRDGPPDIEAVRLLAARELSTYKLPRTYRVVESLPRNAMGKVVRRDLRHA
ncbi:MAG TPA: AMP-binding protein [Acidimicrobiales bacterium]|jgi:malonyl-CoA/methylmalonyl-CoA synthetase|nr:AMP-binding protein [Acidimicrobiales bacterium]